MTPTPSSGQGTSIAAASHANPSQAPLVITTRPDMRPISSDADTSASPTKSRTARNHTMERDKGNPFHQPPVHLHPQQDDPLTPQSFTGSTPVDDSAAMAPWALSHGIGVLDDFDAASEDLLDLLWDLDGVTQDPRHHPEGDALYHSLQVFQHALTATDDPILLAAALFHDVGKSEGNKDHAARGAAWLEAIGLPEWVCWLVAHHMDLLHTPARTRRRLAASQPTRLAALEALRRWDRAGRDPHAQVMSPEEAIERLTQG